MTRSLKSWNFAVEWILTSFHPNGHYDDDDDDDDDDGNDGNDGGTAGAADEDDNNGDDLVPLMMVMLVMVTMLMTESHPSCWKTWLTMKTTMASENVFNPEDLTWWALCSDVRGVSGEWRMHQCFNGVMHFLALFAVDIKFRSYKNV